MADGFGDEGGVLGWKQKSSILESVVDDYLVEPPDLFDRHVPARIKIKLPGARCLVGVTLDPESDTSSLSAAITSTCASRTRRRERDLRSRALYTATDSLDELETAWTEPHFSGLEGPGSTKTITLPR
jgi:hypothetical protein